MDIIELKNRQLIWQANRQPQCDSQLHHTGFTELDAQLGGGFASSGVVEIRSPVGIGELRLLLPYLSQRQQKEQRLLVLIAPPQSVNSEILVEWGFALHQVLLVSSGDQTSALWAAEQCLKSGCCYAVLLWQHPLQQYQVKRLQLAAQKGDAIQIVFRPANTDSQFLPVSLSMQLAADPLGLQVTIKKRKGGWPGQAFSVNMRRYFPELCTVHGLNDTDNLIPFPQQRGG